jgi:RNA polymerase sigma factor (sigma-70 family)
MELPEGQDGAETEHETGALRSWLVGGTRRTAIDPRRRSGANAKARRLLTSDEARQAGVHGGWLGLVAALQRHTVRDAMAEMPKEDRNILTLAYLHGHTNDQIAQALNVSVRTVSRRLTNALGKLEQQVTSLGVWMLSAVLVVLASLRSLREHQAMTIVAVSAATVVAIGVVASNPAPAPAKSALVPSTGHSIAAGLPADTHSPVTQSATSTSVERTAAAALDTTKPANKPSKQTVVATNGCGGNPTDAPPSVPVGPRGPGPHSAPVTHPGKGGCGPKA